MARILLATDGSPSAEVATRSSGFNIGTICSMTISIT